MLVLLLRSANSVATFNGASLALIALPLSASVGMNITLGLLMRQTSDGVRLGDYWDGMSCAAVLAVRHVNARNGSVVPALGGLSGTHFRAVVRDTGSVPLSGIISYREAVEQGAHAIVGAARSAVTMPIATLSAIDKLPMMSYWSSSPELSEVGHYSHFSRTYPSDAAIASTMVSVLEYYGWANVAIVSVIDPWAAGYVEVVSRTAAESATVTIVQAPVFASGDTYGIRNAVERVSMTGANVFIIVLFDDDLEVLINEAYARGLLTADHVWLSADTLSVSSISRAADPPTLASRLDGFLMLRTGSTLSDGFRRLSAVWGTLSPADCSEALVELTPSFFDSPPPTDAGYVYDAVAALALAIDRAEDWPEGASLQEVSRRANRTLSGLAALDFDGASGRIRFTQDTLDRHPASIQYTLANLRYNASAPPAKALELPTVAIVRASGNVSALTPLTPRFIGGGSEPPPDVSEQQRDCPAGSTIELTPKWLLKCIACAIGKYENRGVCMAAESLYYAPTPGVNVAGLHTCPNNTRVTQVQVEPEGLVVTLGSGAISAVECTCVRQPHLMNVPTQSEPSPADCIPLLSALRCSALAVR